MSSAPINNILITGATGIVGAPILSGLLAEPSFNVTILSRATSTAKFPANIPVKRISDAFTLEELTSTFRGHDTVVIATAAGPVSQGDLAIRFIDAAVAAGVKRFIPSEFGVDNLDPVARKTNAVYEKKGEMLEYLMRKAEESEGRFTWTTFVCGSWMDLCLKPPISGSFYSLSLPTLTGTIYDSGHKRFAVSTTTNTGLAVSRTLLDPSATANRQIFLSDFVTSARELLAELEKQLGRKFTIEHKASAPVIERVKGEFEAGEWTKAYELLALTFVTDNEIEYDYENSGVEVWNHKLGLPKVTLEQVVREVIKAN